MSSNTIFIIDAHAFLHRSYHALPKLTTSKGEPVGALYGFLRLLLKIKKEFKPQFAAVCFDSQGGSFRDKIFSDYKANRKEIEHDLLSQLKAARELPAAVGMKTVAVQGYEADDLIAAIAGRFRRDGFDVVIVTGDKDAAQLVGNGVSLWDGSAPAFSGSEAVMAKFGVGPERIADYLALTGDSSDNVPGVAGIGPKGAVKLLTAYGSFAGVLAAAADPAQAANDKLLAKVAVSRADAELSRRLVALDDTAPLTDEVSEFSLNSGDAVLAGELARRFEFRDLAAITPQPTLFDTPELPAEISLAAVLAGAKSDGFVCLVTSGGAICAGSDKGAAYFSAGAAGAQEKTMLSVLLQDSQILKVSAGLKALLHLIDFDPLKGLNNFTELELAHSLLNARKSDFSKLLFETSGLSLTGTGVKEELLTAAGTLARVYPDLKKALHSAELDKVYFEMELPLIPLIYAMERRGFKVEVPKLQELSFEFKTRLSAIEAECVRLTGHEVNLNSPKQLSWLLYEKLNLQLDEEQKKSYKTKDGYSTAEEVLNILKPAHPVIEKLLEFRELSKLKSSFIDPLIAAADSEGRVHTSFDQTGAATGRFSSSNPNLQNIPVKSKYGQEIRRVFCAKKDFTLLCADYSQIDLRVLAHLSGDMNLTAAFRSGTDIHARTAAEIFGVMPELVSSEQRRAAKAINFGIVYGQSAQGLSRELGISRTEAAKYIKHYFEAYPGVKLWTESVVATAKKNGFVTTFTGRRRPLADLSASNRNLRSFAERMAVNTPVQGGSADIIKKAMLDLRPILTGSEDIFLLSQVHDELIFEVRSGRETGAMAQIRPLMENAYALSVPLVVTLKTGTNWQDCL